MSDTDPVLEPPDAPSSSGPSKREQDDATPRTDVASAPALQRRDSGGGDVLS